MYVYLIMLILSLFFAYVFRNNKKIAFIMSFLPFFLISALRYDVGTDYMYRYVPEYLAIYNGKYSGNIEPIFEFFYKIGIFIFGNNYQSIFIITSFIINFLVFLIIYKYSKNVYLSIVLFFITGYFFYSLNAIRQFICMVILLSGYKLIVEKKYIKWILLCILTTMIHNSSIIGIILIPLSLTKKINIKLFLCIISFYLLFNKQIENFIINIISLTRFYNYFGTIYGNSSISMTLLIKNIVVYLFMWYLNKTRNQKNEENFEDKLFLNIQATAIIMALLGDVIMIFARITYYFQIFQIISIPYFIYSIKNNNKQKKFLIIIVLFFSILLINSNVLNNHNEVLPYKSIFER